jgi:hypothetical protein
MYSSETTTKIGWLVIVIYLTFLPAVRYNIFVTNNSKIFKHEI